ncbi:MAG: TIR domain-containing protein, partial [Chloroflexi bacterium]
MSETPAHTPTHTPTPPSIFFSYSRADSSIVERLRTDLGAQGITTWVDREGIRPGTPDWEESLRTAIRAAAAVLLVASPNARSSRYVKDELRIAQMYHRPIYPVWVTGTQWMEVIPLGLGGMQFIDAREERYASALSEIVFTLTGDPFAPVPDTIATPHGGSEPNIEPRNPYKGLRPFTSADAHDFFGRDALIQELLEALKVSLTKNIPGVQSARLLAVVGTSGSGKSSVVMAGLLPCLQTGGILGSKGWVYLDPVVPGVHPIESLTLALSEKLHDKGLKTIREDLEDDPARGLHLYATALAKPQGTKVVLFVDQFEELFTLTTSEDERRQFVDLLINAITEPGGPVVLILTLRVDFSDRPMQYPELYRLIDAHHSSVLPMEMDDLRGTIEQPAALPDVQLTFEGDLVGDLLFEIRGQTGALPLLQFTLDQLFQRRSGHQLSLQSYREIGGVKGALSQHAEETYQELPSDEHRQVARDVFLRLIKPGTTEQDTTRRRAARSEFEQADSKQTQQMQETLEAFIRARLLTTNQISGKTTIEVSHEALIREWKRLAEWLREARDDILFQQSLSEDSAEWEQRKRPRDRLYRGVQLKEALTWARRNRPSEQEVVFLRASAIQRTLLRMGVIAVVLLLLSLTGIAGGLIATRPPDPTVVTTLQDNVNGSLRYCIENAPSESTIRFAQSLRGTVKLTAGILVFAGGKRLTISGPGANQLTISGGKTYSYIDVSVGATVKFSSLSFKNSKTFADAFLYNEGTLTVTNSIISDNVTMNTGGDSYGGGIENTDTGTLTVTNSIISDNKVTAIGSDSFGGGIDNDGRLTVTNSTFSNNSSSSDQVGKGGSIYNDGTLIVTNSTFSNNSSSGDKDGEGGGIYNESTLTVTHSTFSN